MATSLNQIAESVRKVNSAGWEGTPLQPGSRFNPISYENKVIQALRPTTVLERVANLSFVDNVQCGYPRARISEPQGYVSPIEEDGQLKPQEFEYGCEEFMDIEYGFGCLRKMSKEQKQKFECNDPGYLDMLMKADVKEGRLVLEKVVLSLIVAGVNGKNQGLTAGVSSGCYNMGSPFNPITWTPDSAEEIFQNAKMIFNEFNLETEMSGLGSPWAMGHPFIEKAFFNNDRISSYYHQGGCVACPRVTGAIGVPIYGFDVIKTPCLPSYNIDGKTVYPLVFGFRDATDVIVEFEQVDRTYPIVGDRSYFFEKWWDFGAKVWDGRKLAIAWITIEGK